MVKVETFKVETFKWTKKKLSKKKPSKKKWTKKKWLDVFGSGFIVRSLDQVFNWCTTDVN